MDNIKKKIGLKLLYVYSNLVNYKEKIIKFYDLINKKYNKYLYKNSLVSIEFIDLTFKNITKIKLKYNTKYCITITNFINNSSLGIYNLNYCNCNGEIISYIITCKQFQILSRNKNFIKMENFNNLINSLNSNKHISVLHSGINNIEITYFTKKYIKSLQNITVSNFMKFLQIKSLLYQDTKKSDLIIMDSDLLDEYVYKHKEIIVLTP